MAERVEGFSHRVTGLSDQQVADLSAFYDPTKVQIAVSAYNGNISGFVGTNSIQLTMASEAMSGNDAAHLAAQNHLTACLQELGVDTFAP